MAEPARHLHLVDGHGEVVSDVCHGCIELSKKVAYLAGENTKLRRAEEERQASSVGAKQIREVLEYWRPLCMPRAKIVVGSERWQKTKARLHDKDVTTGELAYTPQHLKAAVVGAKLSPEHVANGWLDASTIFRDSGTVDRHIFRCVQFKRETGASALEIVDELMGPGLAKLAARCTCGHLRLDHERENPMLEIWDPPCAVHGCSCERFDSWEHEIDLWMAQRDHSAREAERERMGS